MSAITGHSTPVWQTLTPNVLTLAPQHQHAIVRKDTLKEGCFYLDHGTMDHKIIASFMRDDDNASSIHASHHHHPANRTKCANFSVQKANACPASV